MRARRRHIIAAGALFVVVIALLFLQLPGLDSWRFHTVATWRVTTPSTLDSSLAPQSPGYSLRQSVPARVHYAWDMSPSAYAAMSDDPADHQLWVNDRSSTAGLGPQFVSRWWPAPFLERRGHEGVVLGNMAEASGTFYLAPAIYGHDDFRLSAYPYVADSSLVVTISEPYAYYYLPLEDYLLVALLAVGLAVVSARWVSRLARRRGVSTSGETEA